MLKILIERDGTPSEPGAMTTIDIETRHGYLYMTASKAGRPAEIWRRVRIERDPKRGLYPTLAEAFARLCGVEGGNERILQALENQARHLESQCHSMQAELDDARRKVKELEDILRYEEAS